MADNELTMLLEELDSAPSGEEPFVLGILALCAEDRPEGGLRRRAARTLGPLTGAALAFGRQKAAHAFGVAAEGAANPFCADADAQDCVVSILRRLDDVEAARQGALTLGIEVTQQGWVNGVSDEALRVLLDATLTGNELRRLERPPSATGWWWSYRIDCEESLLAKSIAGSLSPNEQARLDAHLLSCVYCTLEHESEDALDQLLRQDGLGAANTCPAPETLDALSRGDLPPVEAEPLSTHVDLCDKCRSLLRTK